MHKYPFYSNTFFFPNNFISFVFVPVIKMSYRRSLLYFLLILTLIIIIYYASEETYFQWLTLLVIIILLLVVDLLFFGSSRTFIFDPLYSNYQKLSRPVPYY